MPPPDLRNQPTKIIALPSDDWTSRIVPAVNTSGLDVGAFDRDPANAGIRREPELPEHEEIVPPPLSPSQEFDILDDEPDVDAGKVRAMRQRMRMVAW